jgi:hypothetical protein
MPTAKKTPAKKGGAKKGATRKTARPAGGRRASPGTPPTSVRVRAYQVGFGDCFLVTFRYAAGGDRHVLIDFGSTRLPRGADPNLLGRVAEDVARECGGQLDAVVATHRHRDHISGFATAGGAETADGTPTGVVIRDLKPKLVVQPWTEHPDLATDATGPARGPRRGGRPSGERRFAAALADMHAIAGLALAQGARMAEVQRLAGKRPGALARQLSFLGENNLPNKSAVENLQAMGGRHEYVHFGSRTRLDALLPGVAVRVLGPPTVDQSDAIRGQRQRDEDEFWHFQARALGRSLGARPGAASDGQGGSGAPLFSAATLLEGDAPPYARWFLPRLRAARGDQLLELVRVLDRAMNNTSVILLFEIGGRSLLFPGDAQIENWSYALSQADVRERLKGVDLYKVGHHGSLNATPRTLWGLFEHRGGEHASGRLRTVVSTLSGVHGHADRGTEVPRRKLVAALRADSDFVTTQEVKVAELFRDVELPL